MIYGYCRVSTSKQSITRQERNIIAEYPNAKIYCETYTGTKIIGRKEFKKLVGERTVVDIDGEEKEVLKGGLVKPGDKLVFDSVSRMSRDADDGFKIYEELYKKGIELIFLKEPQINTSTYKESLEVSVPLTGTDLDFLLEGLNKYLMALAKKQIKLAFEQSEKEVTDLQERTREGIKTAKNNGKQIGLVKGTKLVTKKSKNAKDMIKKHAKCFGGSLTDKELIALCKVTRNTYYKYKKEILEEM